VNNYYWRKTNKYFKSWDGLTDGYVQEIECYINLDVVICCKNIVEAIFDINDSVNVV
jgi:hypothetical protein